MDEEVVLMGINVFMPEWMPPYTPYKGSIQRACDLCGALVWQGPAQQLKKAENPDMKIICAMCAIKGGVRPDTHKIIALTNKEQGQ